MQFVGDHYKCMCICTCVCSTVEIQNDISLLQVCYRLLLVYNVVSVLLAEFSKLYESLGVKIIERGESFYQPLMPQLVKDLEAKS